MLSLRREGNLGPIRPNALSLIPMPVLAAIEKHVARDTCVEKQQQKRIKMEGKKLKEVQRKTNEAFLSN